MPKKNRSPRGANRAPQTVIEKSASSSRNVRETIESVAIAFILAFLFRTFEAEAFVIPTGSMAPTLQGQHKDFDCYMCGYRYRINASHEDDEEDRQGTDIVAGTCPQCRYTMTVDATGKNYDGRSPAEVQYGADQPTYPGDRILVGKFAYDFGEPERWDVIVFKFPGDTKINYIKRLVGLPGEEIHIRYGDIYTRPVGNQEAPKIARKPPDKVLAMMQPVYDTNYTSSELLRKNWPLRWQTWPPRAKDAPGDWQLQPISEEELQQQNVQVEYNVDGTAAEERWLRYRHFVPSFNDWRAMEAQPLDEDYVARPQLITDFYAYNTWISRRERAARGIAPDARKLGLHWVGDLMIQADVEVTGESGELLLDLVEGGLHFTCRIDVATGQAKLESSAAELKDFHPVGQTSLQGLGSYQVRFANVDNKLFLWVDGENIDFDVEPTFDLDINRPYSTPEEPGDLAPVGVGSQGAALSISDLLVYRDIYYIAVSNAGEQSSGNTETLNDYAEDFSKGIRVLVENMSAEEFQHFLSDPADWDVFTQRRTVSFGLQRDRNDPGRDQFLVLGDNSPYSKDSRLWSDKHISLKFYVERQLLIGKALCIYWPHSWNRVPGIHFPFPFFPNFGDMGLVK